MGHHDPNRTLQELKLDNGVFLLIFIPLLILLRLTSTLDLNYKNYILGYLHSMKKDLSLQNKKSSE
jgi:hypothetical protein